MLALHALTDEELLQSYDISIAYRDTASQFSSELARRLTRASSLADARLADHAAVNARQREALARFDVLIAELEELATDRYAVAARSIADALVGAFNLEE